MRSARSSRTCAARSREEPRELRSDEDPAADEAPYRHQLLQEYFAARVRVDVRVGVADDGREDARAGGEVLRVLRGGSWYDSQLSARAANRECHEPGVRESGDCGFRVALSIG